METTASFSYGRNPAYNDHQRDRFCIGEIGVRDWNGSTHMRRP